MNGSRTRLIRHCREIDKYDIAFEPYLSNNDLLRIIIEDVIAHQDIAPIVLQPLNPEALLATE